MKKFLVLLLLPLLCLSQNSDDKKFQFGKEVKKVFKFSTFYGAVNGGTSISDDDVYSISANPLV